MTGGCSVKVRAMLAAVAMGSIAIADAATAQIDQPVPTNAYITYNGLDWAWAGPIANPSGSWLGYQASRGWRLPTQQELANAPNAANFLFAGANAPFGGSDPLSGAHFEFTDANYDSAHSAGACATPYFGSTYLHCDYGDGNGESATTWAGTSGNQGNADQLFVRSAATPGVPEPATWTTLILGFGAVGAMLRQRRRLSLA
jgi:hypothetical protein